MPEPKKSFFDFALLRRVFRYAAPYKKKFYLSVALAILLAIITPIRPMLIQQTVNDYIAHSVTRMVINITLFQIGLLLIETAMRFLFSFTTALLGQSVVKDLRVATYNKIMGLNLSQFDKTPIGTLTTRTVNDIESINDIFSDGLVPIIADLLSIACVLVFMFWTDWQLTFIALIPFPIIIIATYYFKNSINRSFFKVRNAVASLNAFVQEHLTGMAIVQAFAAEEREADKFRKINREHRNANIKAIFAYSVFFPVVEIVLALSIGLAVWWTSKEAFHLQQSQQGTLVAFILCLNLLFRPLRVLADKFNILQMGIIASERVFKVLDNKDYATDVGDYTPEVVKGKIEFDKVSFAYTDDKYVLKDVSFEAKPGETIAIVGHTGSGKTTIISLLNRLYHIQKGQIKIDDIDIEDFQLNILRKNVGVVLQDVFLFSGSVVDNITLRNPGISKEKVIEAAKMIDMHDFIMRLPGGYDYNVMERGATLSLGQRQLLSFIRALLYNPSILILDEATSSVDTESEMLIQHAIDTLIKGRTSIVIAHRLSTIRKASKIIVLDKGEVKEMGTHDELLALRGYYFKLYQLQFDDKTKVS
ncbi:MAG: ABC transporter ATP-binding protein [Chitinophagaceae bacterium]|nr:ABC transporter ATP-binding protein [Chitinophagaceae bacterium]MBK7678510.1 ABC transporter ATP-binding protein [Chitinophagaceae bacterium]MBK8300138.1 ABC transporter ATP-binding protein [Chitinophagaceae bacterium]MBK9464182.1 ABC transporter ATP-binding protein [Chitinophagaceae bacterium]MBK9658696.1 ABC transporter ATP-binding protein [Chitinophagaceae bacterium]